MWPRIAALTGVVVVVAAVTGAAVWFATRPAPPSVVRTTIATSGSTALARQGTDPDLAITPDGSRVVYRGNNQLLVRSLNQLEPTVLSGLGAPRGVFISPDGQWVGFFDASTMKKVAITGGPPVTIALVDGAAGAARCHVGCRTGPSFSRRLQTRQACSVYRPPAATPRCSRNPIERVAKPITSGPSSCLEATRSSSRSLRSAGVIENAQIAVLDLRTGTSKVLVRGGSHAHYVPTGHLVYGVAGTLRAVAFDLARLEATGTPAPVLEGVVTTATGAADVAVAANGSLVYVPGTAGGGGRETVVSVDRQGRVSPLPGVPPDSYRDVRVSPMGRGSHWPPKADVWIYDFARATLSRLTTDPAQDTRPLWTPTGGASSSHRLERATRSCSGGRRMALAATSGSSRVRRISSTCAPTAGREMAGSFC